jgi:hypothetical protein
MSEAGDVVGITHLRIAVATLELSLGDLDAAWQTLERSAGTTGVHRDFVLVRVVPCAIEALVAPGRLSRRRHWPRGSKRPRASSRALARASITCTRARPGTHRS